MTKGTIDWLLRFAFVINRRTSQDAGVVLPTVVMLILVVSLSVGALTYRAYTRNTQVIASNQQRVIYNAATPAIDRARSKLEYMFDSSEDVRYPSGGVPEEPYLLGMMLNAGTNGVPKRELAGSDPDPYTLPGETRLKLPIDSTPARQNNPKDNAWSFRTDTNGDGKEDATVIYSILFETPYDPDPAKRTDPAISQRLLVSLNDKEKAAKGYVRHGPLTTETGTACQLPSSAAAASNSVGWFNDPTSTSVVRKNFQVDVLVVPDDRKVAASTLEFHQDREISKGNKWGAWFRNDLEVFPGPEFRFNGAMHTEGNFIAGGVSGQTEKFQAYLISSKNSCLYPPIENSEISITETNTGKDEDKFKGVIIAGTLGSVSDKGGFKPHYQKSGQPAYDITVKESNDGASASSPQSVYSDPKAILTADKRQTAALNTGTSGTRNNRSNFQEPTYSSDLKKRIVSKREPTPYIDDLSRADNRWGPKSTYGLGEAQTINVRPDHVYGSPITGFPKLTDNNSVTVDPSDPKAKRIDENVGADGYWERRARNEGLRVIVGERLELGNPFGWVTPRDGNNDNYITPDPAGINEREGDPLYPPEVRPYPVLSNSQNIPHLQQQRRTLRDNLAAVQSTALYHSDFNFVPGIGSDYPFACLATTNHPGTPTTIRQSINFVPTRFKETKFTGGTLTPTNNDVDLLTDFFLGRGTNGWEFQPPAENPTAFAAAIVNGQPLGIALRNLAHFAGDPDGAFPPKQESGANAVMHPYPALSMWGNFSNLRRALALIDSGVSYDALSIADKTYIQTAACTVGMLAYEIDTVQKFDPTNPDNNVAGGLGLPRASQGKLMLSLGMDLYDLMGINPLGGTSDEDNRVLPRALTKTSEYNSNKDSNGAAHNPRDFYDVPPEAYIEALRQRYTNTPGVGNGVEAVNNAKLRMAELIMLNFQIRRDRTFGFRPSPSFGHYAIQTKPEYVVRSKLSVAAYPSACDPDLFALSDSQEPVLTSPLDRSKGVSITSDGEAQRLDSTTTTLPVVAIQDDAKNEGKLIRARLGLSRLCGALTIPSGYDPLKYSDHPIDENKNSSIEQSEVDKYNNQARPVVMPKFPALYYIFPEQTHGLGGDKQVSGGADSKIPDIKDEYDTRQPGSEVLTTDSEKRFLGLESTDREPYVIDDYIRKASVSGSYSFRPVVTSFPPVRPPTPLFSKANQSLNPLSSLSFSVFSEFYPAPFLTNLDNRRDLTAQDKDLIRTINSNGDSTNGNINRILARFPDENRSVFPVPDLSVAPVAIKPRNLPGAATIIGADGNWVLPSSTNVLGTTGNNANVPTNIIEGPITSGSRLRNVPVAVPFLDRALFDGRQLMLSRVLDLDLGMMRSAKTRLRGGERSEPLLPMSGIVYAFREDAIREDAIARPSGVGMDVRKPAAVTDPGLVDGISIKAVDYLPDPERRIHGFRLRNGRQVKRDKAYETGSFKDTDNYRGLSLFTDQPLYIQGDLNRHQTGNDDAIGDPLEEFTGTNALIRGKSFNEATFYDRGGGGSTGEKDTRFASLDKDRWRPTELLADSISILSDDFCDGSISDMFVSYDKDEDAKKGIPRHPQKNEVSKPFNRNIYHDSDGFKTTGLYAPGCKGNGYTSFKNSDFPSSELPTVTGKTGRYDWLRENPNITSYNAALVGTYEDNTMPAGDYMTPVKISRSGLPILRRPPGLPTDSPAIPYKRELYNQKTDAEGGLYVYADPNSPDSNVKDRQFAAITGEMRPQVMPAAFRPQNDSINVNSIIVSGISPSRPGNSYGGLHNFPRLLEDWRGGDNGEILDYAGSFLQLNFSNYATAPWQMRGWEVGQAVPTTQSKPEDIGYYNPPKRQWGYDVALQLAPAGPAASRFVIVKTPRNEFYSEPQINDPYIKNLCTVAVNNRVKGAGNLKCD